MSWDDERELDEIRRIFKALSQANIEECRSQPEKPAFEPPPTAGEDRSLMRAVRVSFAFAAMFWALAIYGCVQLLGCATGRIVEPGLEITCAAIGEEAKVTYSHPTGDAGIITSAPTQLVACEGGPIVPSLLDGVGTLLVSAGKLLFGWIVP